ncbi:MAG: carboxypeptidase-like regulatory domain-containing protein, partial [Bacilli bacterium]|nr:carboxypeptidase-like regulatory domain-containing protein [Bacilli bacterium]
MKKISLVTVVAIAVLFVAAAVPVVSATYEQTLTEQKINNVEYSFIDSSSTGRFSEGNFCLDFYQIENSVGLDVVYVRLASWSTASNWEFTKQYDSIPQNVQFTESVSGENIGYGTITYNVFYDSNNIPTSIQFWVDFYEWDVTGLSGTKRIMLNLDADSPLRQFVLGYNRGACVSPDKPVVLDSSALEPGSGVSGYYIVNNKYAWSNIIRITDDELSLIRNNDYSILKIESGENVFMEQSYDDRHIRIFPPVSWTVTNSIGTNFTGTYSGDDPGDPGGDPGDPGVTVYIKNSQTGAIIANSNIVIDALVNGEYYPIVNKTEPSGIFSINLQPTGGGQPNPDGYRLIATADGYNNPMPEINFTVDDYKKYIYCLLDPIAGGPENENNTFIDFFVRDMSSNPISGATVKFDKYTLITNSQGYTVFEVTKNADYTYTVSKSGYGSLTGNAVIGADPRHTINTVLAPAVTPTKPTPIPTSTSISPTPTLTAPTGEPVSNWLEWFAAHFGM